MVYLIVIVRIHLSFFLLLYSIPSGMEYIGFVRFPIILIIIILIILPPTRFELNSSKTAEQNYTKLKTHMAHISK